MHHSKNSSRRRFLRQTGLGLLAGSVMPRWLVAMEMRPAPRSANPSFNPDVEFDLTAQMGSVRILPGSATRVMQYTASLIKGPDATLTVLPGSYLGPLIRLRKGQKVRIRLRNNLSEPHVTHWHGLHVPAEMDGHPMAAIQPGETLFYEFEVLNRAGLHIYHPHAHEATATQVYRGLAGGILINDEEEAKLDLPAGEFELPVVIQDRRFDDQNQLVYAQSMHDRMMGFAGDQILVNGRPKAQADVASRAYRLRVMNGSNSRIYKLGWSDGTPVTIIGVDGGLLEAPRHFPYVMLAPGERLDVWADFSGQPAGAEVTLRSLAFSGVLPKMAERMGGMGGMGHGKDGGMGHGMGGGMMGGNALPIGSEFPVMKFRVTRKVSDSPKLPSHLSSLRPYTLDSVTNPDKPLPIGISEAPMSMLLNGRPYKPNDFLPSERIPVNTIQLMEIFHAHGGGHGGGDARSDGGGAHGTGGSGSEKGGEMSGHSMGGMGGGMGMMGGHGQSSDGGGSGMHGGMGGMGMMGGGGMGMMGGGAGMGGMGMMLSMAHPIHLHGQQFQVISRTVDAAEATDYATVKDGLISEGLKDTVLVMPGERVRIIKPFEDFKGVFMYHCHNLEHEDMGMMREFLIE